jgi:voltage-gated potassium channel Kch
MSSYLISYNEHIYRFLIPFFRLFGPDKRNQVERVEAKYDAWIIGYHRIGIKVAEALTGLHKKFSVIDFDPEAIERLRKDKVPFYFGDVADIEFLENLPLTSSKMVVMTIPAVDDQINLIKHIRKFNSKVLVIANAYHRTDAKTLYKHGANFVMMPHLVGGEWISKILRKEKWDNKTLDALKKKQHGSLHV